ncbi:SAF domain-containing protein [Aneurinibacillus terranovensis]|uniref:SAF domain-containing protein n=1 Tax=Aneurinibacillus terranovensis TaxID=278991 RepID=UPI001FE14179|nr:SAF domain-containing protein [Aneurinibacillus terranovensis]
MNMSINKKSTWFLLFALVFAAILAVKVNATVNAMKNEVKVVQTTKYIPPYTVITPEMITIKSVPATSVIEGTFGENQYNEVIGKRTALGLLPETNIQKGHLISLKGATLEALLYSLKNSSLVAASIPLSANDIGAQINPGDTIHLNGVFNMQNNQIISKYVAQYVPVLGIDKKDDGTARMYVAVKKEDFPDIARSIDTGRIRAVIVQKEYEQVEKTRVPNPQSVPPSGTPSNAEGANKQ